jgi:hypothetical protein
VQSVHTASVQTAALAVLVLAPFAPVHAQNAGAQPKRPAGSTYERYQIAAGTLVAIELRTSLSSATARVGDPVDGRLLRALVAEDEDVELVPAGATVLGTVREVEPAGKKTPGRLAFAFHVIEHPETGSRASVRTTLLSFESERARKAKTFADLRLSPGTNASVTLLAPLSVKIPVVRRVDEPSSARSGQKRQPRR